MPTIAIRIAAVAAIFTASATASAPARAAKPMAVTVAATEVSFKNAKTKRAVEMGEALRMAAMDEARFYDPAKQPAILRIRIEGVGFKSAGKAIAGNIPLIGMVAGENRNRMKGRVELIDQASGRSLAKYKIEADDDTMMSLGDAALIYGKVGLSFLPFGGLISAAADVAEGAANRRDQAEAMLTRSFVMLSYRKAYGDRVYKSFASQRKAALASAKAGAPAPVGPAPVAPAMATIAAASPTP